MKYINKFLLLFFLLLATSFLPVFAQKQQANKAKVTQKPALVVGIVVDQMRYDYIYRFWDKYGDNGFKRLVNEGFNCKNANYNYMPTSTAPGHSSIYTGTTPSVHGIIGNSWFSKELNRYIYCTEDTTVKTVGATASDEGEMSPKNMFTSTITDELRLASNLKAKVIGISLKDRGAILPAGHLANAAYWFNGKTGTFITSTFYMEELPDWVKAFNGKDLVKKYMSTPWATLLPIEQYAESIKDDNPYEGVLSGGEKKPVFPHDLPALYPKAGPGLIRHTPFGNSLIKEFAIDAIKSENLGKRGNTDFIAVSFSSPDYIGHKFGPRSIELEDTYIRLDQDIAELLNFLDNQLGRENVLVFLSADHGVAETPAYLTDLKMQAGYFDSKIALQSLKSYLYKTYGDSLLSSYANQQIYLKDKVIEAKKIDRAALQQDIAHFMLQFNGVASTVTAHTLKNAGFSDGGFHLIQNGFHQKRSGDVIINLLPGWMEFEKTGTTHGSVYSYDTHIPLLWYGWGVKKGSSATPINIIDIAPTVALLLNLPFPNGCLGKPIPELVR